MKKLNFDCKIYENIYLLTNTILLIVLKICLKKIDQFTLKKD